MRSRLMVAVAVLVAFVALPSRADACTCAIGAPICETFWATPLVFSGTVMEIVPDPKSDPRTTLNSGRLVRFRVTQTWRGEATGTIEIRTGMGGGDCGYAFVRGQQYLVYAHGSPGKYATGICSRTRVLSGAVEDLKYLETALQPSAAGRIFGTATYQRTSRDVPVRPVAGYTVTLKQGEKQWTATTGSDGGYEFRNIPAGSYSIALSVPDTEDVFGPTTADLVDPRGCAAANFTVVTDGRISARLVDAEGRPLPAVTFEVVEAAALRNASAPPYGAVHTSRAAANGAAEVGHLSPNQYVAGINIYQDPKPGHPYPRVFYPGVFDIAEARVIDLAAGERIDLADFVLPAPLAAKTITGTVRWPDGEPAGRVTISLRARGEHGPGRYLDSARVDAQGRFTFPALAGQRYSVMVRTARTRGGEEFTAESEFGLRADSEPIALVLRPSRR